MTSGGVEFALLLLHHAHGFMYKLLFFVTFCNFHTLAVNELLNRCLDAKYHKTKPGVEDELHEMCSPWKDHACCTKNTSHLIPNGQMYHLNFDHCAHIKNMSDNCKRHFTQDLCFYECEPNLGPWMLKVNMKHRKERAFEVPLCAADCDEWFSACRNDYTCAANWVRNLTTKNGRMHCPPTSECKTFKEIYKNSSNFCEQVWDHSWKYTPNEQPCMRIWFDGVAGNPNRKVAEFKIREQAWRAAAGSLSQTLVAMVLTIVVTITIEKIY
uniref:Folate receptor-like domain-containing protein n=1 Tax=Strigamia maritima TaxID=126957 RepID=T1J4T1_STRMM